MKPATSHGWSLLLAGAVVAALFTTLHAVRATPGLHQQIRRRQADIQRLQELARRHAGDQAALEAVAAAGPGAPALAELTRHALPGVRVEVQERESRALIEDWSVQWLDVMLEDVHLVEAGRYLAGLESGRPPWHVAEIQITASEGAAGRGRVTLLAEGLQRAAGKP